MWSATNLEICGITFLYSALLDLQQQMITGIDKQHASYIRSSHNHHFDCFTTVLHYLCVSMSLAVRAVLKRHNHLRACNVGNGESAQVLTVKK